MTTAQLQIIGMAWYTQNNYPDLLKLFTDSDKLPTTYEKWHKLAIQAEQRLNTTYPKATIVRVNIAPDEFKQWCIDNKAQADAQARTRYASLMAHHIHTKNNTSTH